MGAPALGAISQTKRLDDETFEAEFGISPSRPFLLVTLHPPTLDEGDLLEQVSELLGALDDVSLPCIFTSPNTDPGGQRDRLPHRAERDPGIS